MLLMLLSCFYVFLGPDRDASRSVAENSYQMKSETGTDIHQMVLQYVAHLWIRACFHLYFRINIYPHILLYASD